MGDGGTAARRALAGGLLLAALAGAADPARAVTIQIAIGAHDTTFEADPGGGLISGLAVTIAGVLFDTPEVGTQAPVYNPIDNDIEGNPGQFGFFLNATAGPGCAVLDCLLAFENRIDNVTPPLWSAFPLNMGFPGEVFASGAYSITPPSAVPAPTPVVLLATALAGLGLMRLLRRRAG